MKQKEKKKDSRDMTTEIAQPKIKIIKFHIFSLSLFIAMLMIEENKIVKMEKNEDI